MAYRRKSSGPRSGTFEDFRPFPDDSPSPSASSSSPSASESSSSALSPSTPPLAAQAIRASAAHRDSSLSSAYGESAFSAASRRDHDRSGRDPQHTNVYEYTSMNILNETKTGFWDVLNKKTKGRLNGGNSPHQIEDNGNMLASTSNQPHSRWSAEIYLKTEIPSTDAIASSLKEFGGTIKNAFEEGLTIMENKTAGIIQETKKLQIRRKPGSSLAPNQSPETSISSNQTDYETQLKASRDVANAMAAKAKLILRELKTVRADLAFAKERCSQLEEENKILRESRQKRDNPADDDLIRLQLETLLAEKARLAQENSVYARENRFLREVVEYHQFTMQDVVYLDEGTEEAEVLYPTHEVTSLSLPPFSEPELVSPACLPKVDPVQSLSSKALSTPGSPKSHNTEQKFISETGLPANTISKTI